ncbi:hypothetical protein IWQ61_007398 [Dispira simplex]|nr:hypothetical protein IWQ61_007398 [Dispira simplex]
MGKRNVGKGKNKGERLPRSGQYLRMNFLYEASALLTSLSTDPHPLEKPATATFVPLENGLVVMGADESLANVSNQAAMDSEASCPMFTASDQFVVDSDGVVSCSMTNPTTNTQTIDNTNAANITTANRLTHSVYPLGKDLVPLARFYCHTMKKIAQRSVTRLDPNIKRSICQRCEALLMPGITCQSRLVRKAPRTMGFKCQVCCHQRNFVQNRTHKLFINDPKHQVWEYPESKPRGPPTR